MWIPEGATASIMEINGLVSAATSSVTSTTTSPEIQE